MGFKSWFKEFARRLKSPPAIIGGVIVIFYIIIALLAPVFAPPGDPTQGGDPYKMPTDGLAQMPKPPSEKHPFGTTRSQYDLYYGCIWGARFAFHIGFSIVLGALVVGSAIGAVAGYLGGFIDELVMRFTDIFLYLPGFIFAMALVMVLYPIGLPPLGIIILALALVGGLSYARIVRGEIFRIKHENHIKAVEDFGYHPATDLIYPMLIMPLLDIGPIVLTVATLSFLGLGPPEGTTEWGQIIRFSMEYIAGLRTDRFVYWYTYVIPGLFIFFFVLGWFLLGDAFRDILDPVKRKIIRMKKSEEGENV